MRGVGGAPGVGGASGVGGAPGGGGASGGGVYDDIVMVRCAMLGGVASGGWKEPLTAVLAESLYQPTYSVIEQTKASVFSHTYCTITYNYNCN